MKQVIFRSYGNVHVACDEDARTKMDILLRLNHAGRGRWKEDPTNASVVIDVLSQVTDELDCVFAVLLDCSFLFGSRPV